MPLESWLSLRSSGTRKPVDQRAELLLEAVGVEAGGEPADFGGGHPFVKRRSLGQVTDAAANGEAVAAAIEAEHADFAVCRLG